MSLENDLNNQKRTDQENQEFRNTIKNLISLLDLEGFKFLEHYCINNNFDHVLTFRHREKDQAIKLKLGVAVRILDQ